MDKAIELKPDYPLEYNNRCDSYRQKGEFERALADCNTAIRLASTGADQPLPGIFYYSRGEVYEDMHEGQRAKLDFTKAYELSADHPNIKAKAKEIGVIQ